MNKSTALYLRQRMIRRQKAKSASTKIAIIFLVAFSVCIAALTFIGSYKQQTAASNFNTNDAVAEKPAKTTAVVEPTAAPKVEYIFPEQLPGSLEERKEIVLRFLKEKLNYEDKDLGTWNRIIETETMHKWNADSKPWMNTFVVHCANNVTGAKYARELDSNGRQWKCQAGEHEFFRQQSYGLTHILPTTWDNFGCKDGAEKNWQEQLKCSAKIQRDPRGGWTQWASY